MAYSFQLVTRVSEADSLLKIAERDKRTLEARKQSIAVRAVNSSEDFTDSNAELAAANAKLAVSNSIIATLPDGPDKEEEITKKLELEIKIRKLTIGSTKLDGEAIVEREYDVAQYDAQIAVIDAFITALKAHKATL